MRSSEREAADGDAAHRHHHRHLRRGEVHRAPRARGRGLLLRRQPARRLLLPKLIELARARRRDRRASRWWWTRARATSSTRHRGVLDEARRAGHQVEVLFLDASRRGAHPPLLRDAPAPPAGAGRTVARGHRARARGACGTCARMADQVIDTSALNVHDLKRLVQARFCRGALERAPSLTVMSFGFQHGVPAAGGPGARRALPAQPVLRARAEGADRHEPEGGRVRARPRRRRRRSSRRSWTCCRFLLPALPEGGQGLPHRGARLHGRQAPLGGHRPRAGAAARGRDPRVSSSGIATSRRSSAAHGLSAAPPPTSRSTWSAAR